MTTCAIILVVLVLIRVGLLLLWLADLLREEENDGRRREEGERAPGDRGPRNE